MAEVNGGCICLLAARWVKQLIERRIMSPSPGMEGGFGLLLFGLHWVTFLENAVVRMCSTRGLHRIKGGRLQPY